MTRNDIGFTVARQVRSTEIAFDRAIAEAGQLITLMATGRIEARLAAAVGQDALMSVTTALSSMAGARGSLVAAHGELARSADNLDIPYAIAGPELKPDDDKPVGTILRVAA
jgi:hypothetical protein